MKGWGLEEIEILLLQTFKNKETNKNPEKSYRERNITKAHWVVFPHKRELFCVWALTIHHWGSSEANRAKCSHLQYHEQFCRLLWLLYINQDAREQDLVYCICNWWNGMKFPFCIHNCWPLRHRLPHDLPGAHAERGLPSWAAAQGILNSVLTFILDHASLISVQLGINSHVTAWTGSLAILVAVVSPERNHLCILL